MHRFCTAPLFQAVHRLNPVADTGLALGIGMVARWLVVDVAFGLALVEVISGHQSFREGVTNLVLHTASLKVC